MFSASTINVTIKAAPHPAACWSAKGEMDEYFAHGMDEGSMEQWHKKAMESYAETGGISTWQDAVEMLLAGSTALQIGTVLFTDPYAPVKITEGLTNYMDKNGVKTLSELTGAMRPW